MSTISYRSLIRKFNWKTSLKLQIRSLQITNGALKMHSVVEQKKGIVLFVISSLTSCSVIAIDNYLCSQHSQRPEKKTEAIHQVQVNQLTSQKMAGENQSAERSHRFLLTLQNPCMWFSNYWTITFTEAKYFFFFPGQNIAKLKHSAACEYVTIPHFNKQTEAKDYISHKQRLFLRKCEQGYLHSTSSCYTWVYLGSPAHRAIQHLTTFMARIKTFPIYVWFPITCCNLGKSQPKCHAASW